jgi:hypothetical protein
MAFVKLRCAIPPRFFTDQLSLRLDSDHRAGLLGHAGWPLTL